VHSAGRVLRRSARSVRFPAETPAPKRGVANVAVWRQVVGADGI